MKAAIVKGAEELVVEEVPIPEPGPYEALCRLKYGATCTGTDTHIIENNFPFLNPLPTVFGHESVGEVVACGDKVRSFRIGDLVTRVGMPADKKAGLSVTWGGFAQFGIAYDHWAMRADGLSADRWNGHRVNQIVPHGVDPRVAPMFTTWRETRSFLARMPLENGFRLLVIGSGGNGFSFAAQARQLGAGFVAMAGSKERGDIAALAGIDEYFDYHEGAVAGEYDVILDAVGRIGAVDTQLPRLSDGGFVAFYGIDDYRRITINPTLAKGSFTVWSGGYDEAETHAEVSDSYLSGALSAKPWYDVEAAYPLSDIAAAFEDLRARRGGLKALISLD